MTQIHAHVHVQVHFHAGSAEVSVTRRYIEHGKNRFRRIGGWRVPLHGATEGPEVLALALNYLADAMLDYWDSDSRAERGSGALGGGGGDTPLPGLGLDEWPPLERLGGLEDLDFTV